MPNAQPPGSDRAVAEMGTSAAEYDTNGSHPLRAALAELGGPLRRWTVMKEESDPFRMDTPANHRDAAWLAAKIAALRVPLPIHVRGLHYALLGQTRPDGSQYINTDKTWQWLERVASVARTLNYVDYESITDRRSEEPVLRLWTPPPTPRVGVYADFEPWVPDVDDLTPTVGVHDFAGSQPYHLAIVGEKSSLEPVLGSIASAYGADLFLATGDLSNTMVYRLAKAADTDGRPLEVFYFSDCDPAGYHMSIVLAHKLSAFKISHFPELEFRLWPVALTPEQVRAHPELPSTPLKDCEQRADRWREAFGVDQTEIDAVATLNPDLLSSIAAEAISPFHDGTLDARVSRAKRAWVAEAQQILDQHISDGYGDMEALRDQVAEQLADKAEEMHNLIASIDVNIGDDIDWPDIEIPEHRLPDDPAQGREPLCDSSWPLAERIDRLRAAKRYEEL
jgi:hypothetical protein